MLIKLWQKKREWPQEKIDFLESKIQRWANIRAVMRLAGWNIINGDLKKLLERKSDIRNNSNQTEEYRKGFCDGLTFHESLIRSYERAAQKAGETLELAAKDMKGN